MSDVELPTEAYPLAWPVGWKRTTPHQRKPARYKVMLAIARDELVNSLRLMGVRTHDLVLSTNIPIRGDGLPYASWREPDDPGVAVYWTKRGPLGARGPRSLQHRVIACDSWRTVRENLRAVGLAVEALRSLERTGASEILDRAFAGFKALPETAGEASWRVELGLSSLLSEGQIKERYWSLARERHPDKPGGSEDAMKRLNAARDAALDELKSM